MTVALLLLLMVAPPEFVMHSRLAPVRDLLVDGSRLWAATPGGIAELAGGRLRANSSLQGLPTNDQHRVVLLGGRPVAVGRFGASVGDGERWQAMAPRAPLLDVASNGRQLVAVTPERLLTWRAGELIAREVSLDTFPAPGVTRPLAIACDGERRLLLTAEALWVEEGGWRCYRAAVPQPVVELLTIGREPLLVTPGNLFRWDGAGWVALRLALPPRALQIADVAADGDALLLALYGLGLARRHASGALTVLAECPDITAVAAGPWYGSQSGAVVGPAGAIAPPDGPPGNYVTSLARWRERLVVATLEHGVASLDGQRWRPLEGLASPWVKQLAVYGGRLWIRHADGRLESHDGQRATLVTAGPGLPRAWFSALAATPSGLYAGVYGGLARFNGDSWTTWLHQSPLSDQVVTALAAWDEGLAVGTQGRGLLLGDPARGEWRVYDERHGLGEPWVTALTPGQELLVGTFNRGARRLAPGAELLAPLEGVPATAGVAALGTGLVATREGLFGEQGRLPWPLPDPEVTCLLAAAETLWVGTRSGLLEVRGWRPQAGP